MPNYDDMILSIETRLNGGPCNCYICLTGRNSSHKKIDKGKGHVRIVSNVITSTNGLYGYSGIRKVPKKINLKLHLK